MKKRVTKHTDPNVLAKSIVDQLMGNVPIGDNPSCSAKGNKAPIEKLQTKKRKQIVNRTARRQSDKTRD